MLSFNKKKTIWAYLIIVFFVTLDRILKSFAIKGYFDDYIGMIGNFFGISFAKNYYIAFSLPLNGVWLNIVIGLMILALLYSFVYLRQKGESVLSFLVLFITFGAVSNLFDRIKYGFVIDYFDLQYFTVFNVADVMIVVGSIGLALIFASIDKKQKIV